MSMRKVEMAFSPERLDAILQAAIARERPRKGYTPARNYEETEKLAVALGLRTPWRRKPEALASPPVGFAQRQI